MVYLTGLSKCVIVTQLLPILFNCDGWIFRIIYFHKNQLHTKRGGDAGGVAIFFKRMSSENLNLQDLYCAEQGIEKDAFERKALLACLPRRYWLLGWLRWYLNRSYFDFDSQVIKYLATCRSVPEVMAIYEEVQVVQGFQRGVLGFRVTRKRVRIFAKKYLKPERSSETSTSSNIKTGPEVA